MGTRFIARKYGFDPEVSESLQVLQEADLKAQLVVGSSSEALPSDQHWSKRQHHESLYLSGGSPSDSQRLKDSS